MLLMCFSTVSYSTDVLWIQSLRYNKLFLLVTLHYSKTHIYFKHTYRDFLDITRFLFESQALIFKKNCYTYITINGYNSVKLLPLRLRYNRVLLYI